MRRSPEVVFEVLDGRAVLVDPSGSELITLNPVGTLVWEALDEERNLDQVVDHLLPQFVGVERPELHADVSGFLRELEGLGLLAGRP